MYKKQVKRIPSQKREVFFINLTMVKTALLQKDLIDLLVIHSTSLQMYH